MIQSFADSEAELIWSGLRSRKLPADIQNVALRKLRLLNQARVLAIFGCHPAIVWKR
jgi:proteic killer suppression protein